jgi:16S rRNA (uracil1498-N3)-methyltransferase
MRRRFFVDHFDSESAIIRGETAEHLGRVLRAEPGQLYELSDGSSVWLGRIERVTAQKHGESRIDFALVEPIPACEDPLHIQLLISIVKFDRFEWCLEKATELGSAEIIPLAAARSDKALLAAAQKREARWKRILFESAQQSRRLRPPAILSLSTPGKAFTGCSAEFKIMLSERRDVASIGERLADLRALRTVALAIGPEGGWTDEEITKASASGFAEASLGDNILRTETAVIASLAVLRFGVRG